MLYCYAFADLMLMCRGVTRLQRVVYPDLPVQSQRVSQSLTIDYWTCFCRLYDLTESIFFLI
jgi:hypothetical protein